MICDQEYLFPFYEGLETYAKASLSVAEYLVSAGASTLLQYATTRSTGTRVCSQFACHSSIGRQSSWSLDSLVTSSRTFSPFLYSSCNLLWIRVPFRSLIAMY